MFTARYGQSPHIIQANISTQMIYYYSFTYVILLLLLLSVLHTQYCSGDKIEKNEMGRACSAYGGEERRIQGFGGETWKPEGKRPLGRPKRRWEDNIKRDLQEI